MIGLWIALGIVAGLAALSFVPIHVCLDFENREFLAYAKVGSIRYSLLADTPRKIARKEARLARLCREDGRGDSAFDKTIVSIKDYVEDLQDLWALWPILRNTVVIDRFRLQVLLADDDPADLALHYGQAWAVLGGVVSVVANLLPMKNVDAEPVCTAGAASYDFVAHIRLSISVAHGVRVAWRYLLKKLADKRSRKAMLRPESKGE